MSRRGAEETIGCHNLLYARGLIAIVEEDGLPILPYVCDGLSCILSARAPTDGRRRAWGEAGVGRRAWIGVTLIATRRFVVVGGYKGDMLIFPCGGIYPVRLPEAWHIM